MRALWSLAVAAALVGAAPRANAQTTDCVPACLPGETCVGGQCMVPAPRAPEAPDAQAQATPDAAAPDTAAPEPPAPEPVAAPSPPVVVAPAPVRHAPRPAGLPPLEPRLRQGIVLMPFLGMHSFQDEGNAGTDVGLRVGTLLGKFINNDISLNGSLTFDLVNPSDSIAPAEISAQVLEATFSPLFHSGSPQVEFIVGPKLGVWNLWKRQTVPAPRPGSGDAVAQGWTIGGNVGLLVSVPRRALAGVLFSLDLRDGVHACGTVVGQSERCTWSGARSTLLGLSLAVLR